MAYFKLGCNEFKKQAKAMETMPDDKQFLYISSAQFHQTELAQVLMDQTISHSDPQHRISHTLCDYPCIVWTKWNIFNSNTKLLRMLFININMIWPDIWWILLGIHLLHFWHAAICWFSIVNIAISFSEEILFWFVNPFKVGLPLAPRQILWRKIEWPQLFESWTVLQFSFNFSLSNRKPSGKQFLRSVKLKLKYLKDAPHVNINHYLPWRSTFDSTCLNFNRKSSECPCFNKSKENAYALY
jgi:hypothetical protein